MPGPTRAIADALPHELIAELSRLRWLFVTARGSSFRLRAADADLGEVGRLLGVRYCLVGHGRGRGREPRGHGRARRHARRRRGLGATASRARSTTCTRSARTIRARILAALELQIPLHEATLARLDVTENLDAWSAYHLGLQHMYRFNRDDNAAAAALFERAIARDPGFARAHAGLSFVHFQTRVPAHTDDVAGEIAARAPLRRARRSSSIRSTRSSTSRWAAPSGSRATSTAASPGSSARPPISPNYAQGIYARAWTEALAGRGVEGRGHVDLAMRAEPARSAVLRDARRRAPSPTSSRARTPRRPPGPSGPRARPARTC